MKRTFQPNKKKKYRKFGFFAKSLQIKKSKVLKGRNRIIS